MVMTYEQRKIRRIDRYINGLTEKSDFLGVLGRGYPNSFYKIYVRANPNTNRWYSFKDSGGLYRQDPVKWQKALAANAAESVLGKLPDLAKYDVHPDRELLLKLKKRASQLNVI